MRSFTHGFLRWHMALKWSEITQRYFRPPYSEICMTCIFQRVVGEFGGSAWPVMRDWLDFLSPWCFLLQFQSHDYISLMSQWSCFDSWALSASGRYMHMPLLGGHSDQLVLGATLQRWWIWWYCLYLKYRLEDFGCYRLIHCIYSRPLHGIWIQKDFLIM